MQFELDRASREPLYRQLATSLQQRIRSGALPPRTRLPTVRQLAQQLGVTRLTVHSAYAELQSGALAPLNTMDGYVACATAVLADHPGQIDYADFARYQGSPALVVVIRRASGSTVVAVTAACGVAGDPHELAAVEVA